MSINSNHHSMHRGVGFLQIIDSFTFVYIIYYGHAIVFFVRLVIPSEIIASLHTNFVQLSIVIEWCQIIIWTNADLSSTIPPRLIFHCVSFLIKMLTFTLCCIDDRLHVQHHLDLIWFSYQFKKATGLHSRNYTINPFAQNSSLCIEWSGHS